MAASANESDIFRRLRDSGVRKKVAKQISGAVDAGSKRAPKQVQDMIGELRKVVDDVEDRAKGGPAKRKAAAKKAAATRERKAKKRSVTAKKAATTRKRQTQKRSTAAKKAAAK